MTQFRWREPLFCVPACDPNVLNASELVADSIPVVHVRIRYLVL